MCGTPIERSFAPTPFPTVILARAVTSGAVPSAFPVEPGTLPTRWDGSPLLGTELPPPLKERTARSSLGFAVRERGRRVGHVGPRPDHRHPRQAGAGSLVTIELTTHPRQVTTTLTAIGLNSVAADVPESPGGDDG